MYRNSNSFSLVDTCHDGLDAPIWVTVIIAISNPLVVREEHPLLLEWGVDKWCTYGQSRNGLFPKMLVDLSMQLWKWRAILSPSQKTSSEEDDIVGERKAFHTSPPLELSSGEGGNAGEEVALHTSPPLESMTIPKSCNISSSIVKHAAFAE